MAPAPRAAGWVAGRPLRRARAPTRGRQQPQRTPAHGTPQLRGLSSLAIIGRRVRASSSFVLASALTGAPAAGAPARPAAARRHETRQLRGKPAQQPTAQPQPGDNQQVTGPVHHAVSTEKAPMGGCSVIARSGISRAPPLGHSRRPGGAPPLSSRHAQGRVLIQTQRARTARSARLTGLGAASPARVQIWMMCVGE
jgi:hypothetical protein